MTRATDHQHYRDQVRYSADAVAAYLPAVWDDEFVLSSRPAKVAAEGPRAKPDPKQIPDWLLSAADVQVGYARARLSEVEKECLRHVYHLGYTPGELSTIWGVPSEQVHSACIQGIERITRYLNGRVPQ